SSTPRPAPHPEGEPASPGPPPARPRDAHRSHLHHPWRLSSCRPRGHRVGSTRGELMSAHTSIRRGLLGGAVALAAVLAPATAATAQYGPGEEPSIDVQFLEPVC